MKERKFPLRNDGNVKKKKQRLKWNIQNMYDEKVYCFCYCVMCVDPNNGLSIMAGIEIEIIATFDLRHWLMTANCFFFQRSHLQRSSRRYAHQDIRCAGRMLLSERRLHYPTRCARRHFLHHIERTSSRHNTTSGYLRGKVHSHVGQRRLLWWKSSARVSDLRRWFITWVYNFFAFSDDLRTANIICDSQEGVTCLVIDRETFNQLISNLDEVKNRYNDEGIIERRKWVLMRWK